MQKCCNQYSDEKDVHEGLIELQQEEHSRAYRLLSRENVWAEPLLPLPDLESIEASIGVYIEQL
jgi:hypothetical protein